MSWIEDLLKGTNVGGLLGAAITGAGYSDMVGDLKKYGSTLQTEANRIGTEASAASQFRPYTVATASGGSAGYGQDGNVFMNLGAQEQGLQNQLLGQAGGAFAQAGMPNQMLGQQANLFSSLLGGFQPSNFQYQGLPSRQGGFNVPNLGYMSPSQLANTSYGSGGFVGGLSSQGTGITTPQTKPLPQQATPNLDIQRMRADLAAKRQFQELGGSPQASGSGQQFTQQMGNYRPQAVGGMGAMPNLGMFSGLAQASQAGTQNIQGMGAMPNFGQFGNQAQASQAGAQNIQGMGAMPNFGQFSGQAQASQAGAQNIQGMGSFGTSFRPDTVQASGYGNQQLAQFGNQALGMGSRGLMQAQQAPQDVEAMRGQFAGLTSQSAGDALRSTADREMEVYERIRAGQRPEEERQRLGLEERLAAQGRLGIRTNQFGGTPEQLALAKAQEEAKSGAMLTAMQQAGSEADRALQRTSTLGGMFSQFAGQSSDLQSAAQNRAGQLAQMGMSAQQINSQLQSEGLGRTLQAGQYNREGTMMQDQLTQSSFNRALASGQFGREGQALASQLASQQQSRNLEAMGFNRDTLSSNAALQQQAFTQALQSGQFGREGQALASQLASQQQSRNLEAMGFNRDTLSSNAALQQQAFTQALQSGQFGREGQALASQLASQQQSRNLEAMGFNRDTLSSNAALQQQAFNQALQSGQFGREGQALASQLASQQQARDLASMGFNRDTLGVNSGLLTDALNRSLAQGRFGIEQGQFGLQQQQVGSQLQNEALQRELEQGRFGMSQQELQDRLATSALGRDISAGQFNIGQQELARRMQSMDIQDMLSLSGGSQQALAQQLGLQQGYGQLGQGMLSSAYMPQAQLLNALQQGTSIQQLADLGRRQGAQLGAEAGMAGLEAMMQSRLGAGNLTGQGLSALAGLLGGTASNPGMFGEMSIWDLIT